jgi:hypothetical protein
MRQRLSWNLDKVAEQMKKADPYTMNQEHANNPVEKYHTGDPDAWAETPDTKSPWKGEGRDETNHPAPAEGKAAPAEKAAPAPAEKAPEAKEVPPEQQAVMAARKLEDKALKCITIAQRMLPGAVDASIEEQATDLMYLPERCIMATLQRQAELAETLSGCKDDDDDDATASKKKEEEEEVEAKKKDEEEEVEAKKKDDDDDDATASKKKEEEEEVEAKKKDDDDDEATASKKKEEEEVEAKKKDETTPPPEKKAKKEEKKEEEVEAKKKEDEEEVEAKKKDEEEDVEASVDFLDQFFAKEEVKTGAKKLSGIVKQASMDSNDLSNLWDAPPDVSKNFK